MSEKRNYTMYTIDSFIKENNILYSSDNEKQEIFLSRSNEDEAKMLHIKINSEYLFTDIKKEFNISTAHGILRLSKLIREDDENNLLQNHSQNKKELNEWFTLKNGNKIILFVPSI